MDTTNLHQKSKPIKILYCIDSLLRGGTELQLTGLIERLDPEEFQPYLLTIRATDVTLTPGNCEHLAWDVPKLFNGSGIKAILQLARWLKREEIDIVQTFFQDSTIFAGIAAKLAGTPVRIASCRDLGFWSNRKQRLLMRSVYPLMNAYICNADIVREHFITHFGLSAKRAKVLRNGIDVEALTFVEHTGQATHIGIVGNMTRQVKRTDLFIRAAGIVAVNHPEVTWHIIGDGHLRTELEQLAKDCNVFDKIVFAGRVANVADYLSCLDIGVICSDSEGLSNALLEYLLKGTAAVATAVGGNVELIDDGTTGLLVPPDDAAALADALKRLVENNQLRQTLARTARTKIEREYNWEKCLSDHRELYNELLQQKEGV